MMTDVQETNEMFDFMQDDLPEVFLEERYPSVKKIDIFEPHANKLAHQAQSLIIEDTESEKKALDIHSEAKTLCCDIDSARKALISPSRKFISRINDAAKLITSNLEETERTLNLKLGMWNLKRQKEAQVAQEAVKKLSESLGLDVEIIAPSAPKTMSSANASASFKSTLGFEVVDADLVPREYLLVDEKKISQAIKMGVREIPGIKLVEEKTLIIRRK